MTSTGAVKQDLIISAYKPSREFEHAFQAEEGTPQGVWDFTRQHLEHLAKPTLTASGALTFIPERAIYLLYDRMVAYYLQRGLEENFLQEENGRWRLPDPGKAGDLYAMREKKPAARVRYLPQRQGAAQNLPPGGGARRVQPRLEGTRLRHHRSSSPPTCRNAPSRTIRNC